MGSHRFVGRRRPTGDGIAVAKMAAVTAIIVVAAASFSATPVAGGIILEQVSAIISRPAQFFNTGFGTRNPIPPPETHLHVHSNNKVYASKALKPTMTKTTQATTVAAAAVFNPSDKTPSSSKTAESTKPDDDNKTEKQPVAETTTDQAKPKLETTTRDRTIINAPPLPCPEGMRYSPDRICKKNFDDPNHV